MNILMVIPALGNVYGGPSKSVIELAESIGKLGVGVDIVTTNANGSQVLDLPLLTWIQEKHYRIQYFPYWNLLDYKLTFSLTRWLFQHVTDYDIVHTNAVFSYPVLPAHWACQIHQIPYIMTPHGMLEPWALAYKSGKKSLYFNLLEKPALENASAIQTLASSEAKCIEKLNLNTPLVVVPNGIHRQDFETTPDIELFYQKFPHTRNKTLIIFLGRIDPKKGLDLLAHAFAKVNKQFVETHLIVAGPDNIGFLPTVQSYFSKAGCIDAVTFTGMLTGDIKYAALAAASIYVAPSYSEGFSMSVLEGMATGLPCVITTGCNFPEAGNAGAAYVVDIDVNAIANALIDCLSNPEKAKAMGSRARQLIFDQYTWERIAAKMIEVYTNIIHKNPVYSSVSVIILTYNEAANLPTCLASLLPLNAEIYIVDSGSSDNTIEIAKQAGCQVFSHPFENQAQQLNWALENLPISTPWIMRLDADEHLTPELVEELKQTLPQTPETITGYQVKRRVFFMGRWIRHGGYYPTWLLRVWRTGLAICEQRWMDEHMILSQGEVANLKHDIIDENHKGLSFWTDKHNRYADREVKDMLGVMVDEQDDLLQASQFSQASQRRWVKKNLYTRTPLFLRSFIYFLLRYFIGLGFLDGKEGLIFHFLQGFWYRFLVDAKIYELTRHKKYS